jgi:CBS domain containing-hemolysin-like protein
VSELHIVIGLALVGVTIFFTATHAAIRHFSRVDVMSQLEKRKRAHLMPRLVENRNELLFCLSFIRTSAILGLVLLIAHVFGMHPADDGMTFGKLAVLYALIFVVSVIVIMLAGVAIPMAWARYGGAGLIAATTPGLFMFQRALFPVVAAQHLFDWLARRLAGVPYEDDHQSEVEELEREILGAISEGEAAGAVHEEDAHMIESVMKLRDTDVGEIMTPRTEIVALPATATFDEARELISREGHSRIPVFCENIDDLKGVLYAKDLLYVEQQDGFDVMKMMRQVPFIPESKAVANLLQELREQKVHIAIVLDEYGGTAGLVTIEDILEEIVGEIADEYEPAEPEPILKIDPNTFEVDARVHIDELNEEMDISLPEDEDYDTVGGFVFSELGKIPAAGEELSHSNVRLRVIEAEERRIIRLRVEKTLETPASL